MIAIGLMSGTSADGIDAALVRITGKGTSTRFTLLAFRTYAYPRGYREFLLKNSNPATARLDDITRLHTFIGCVFADAAKKIAFTGNIPLKHVDVIGSHGQTIHHIPEERMMFGRRVRGTLQVGDPSLIAKMTGVPTVGDFRSSDVAVGGTGAPLVPYVDYLLFHSNRLNRAVLNIGGIANITLLPHSCTLADVTAFDTGPGNMLIDSAMQQLFGEPFDRSGRTAYRGKILPGLIEELSREPYFLRRPPKSTGRELFGASFLSRVTRRSKNAVPEDIIATLSEFTALSIHQAFLRFGKQAAPLHELYVSGGGARNPYLMEALAGYFQTAKVRKSDERGFPADAKEAICFAILANETLAGVPSNVPGATGAKRSTILGKICLP